MTDINRLNEMLLNSIVESKDKRLAEAIAQRDELLATLNILVNEMTVHPDEGPLDSESYIPLHILNRARAIIARCSS